MQDMAPPAAGARRAAAMIEEVEGHQLWPRLDLQPQDQMLKKYRYSAFIQGSSALPDMLRAAVTDKEHAASLIAFYLQFGDVLSVDECIGGLRRVPEGALA